MRLGEKVQSRRQRLLLVGVIMVIGILLVGTYRFFYQKESSSSKQMMASVVIKQVERKDLVKNIALAGQTVPKAQVDIAAKYAGKVVGVYAELGQSVQAGQLLIEEDTRDADLSIAQNQHAYQQASADIQTTRAQLNANYNKAKADYDKASNTYARNQQVYGMGGISEDTLDSARQQMEDAKANLDAIANQMSDGTASSVTSAQENAAKAQSTLGSAQKQRNDMLLLSSIDGVVGYRQVENGDMVTVGQKLLSVYDNSLIYVDYQVSEQDLPAFSVNYPVMVNIDSLHTEFPGKVTYVSPSIDSSTLTYTLRVTLENPDNLLRGGMFARASVQSVLRPQTLVLPKNAIQAKNGKNYVFVMDEKNVVTQKEVTLGAVGDDEVEILDGLTEGDAVATTNLSRLRSGIKVMPLSEDSSAGDGSDAS
jgi:HlyD family secretion protein